MPLDRFVVWEMAVIDARGCFTEARARKAKLPYESGSHASVSPKSLDANRKSRLLPAGESHHWHLAKHRYCSAVSFN